MPDIEARGLVKSYGSVRAVANVSFAVERGEIFGLLGPNGAGKTTTLEILEGLREADQGSATVLGEPLSTSNRRLRERIGVQLQATALPTYTTVREAVNLFASFYARARPTDDLLQEFALTDKADAYATTLSGGQLQRLSLALALVNEPDLVFLDEPTTGLDPQARLNLWEVIEQIRRGGRTVVLTTHYMEEAQRLCDRVAIMDRGQIVALDTPTALITAHGPGTRIEFRTPQHVHADRLQQLAGVDGVDTGERMVLRTHDPERVLRALLDPASRWCDGDPGAAVTELRVQQGTLEDVFISLTGRGLRS